MRRTCCGLLLLGTCLSAPAYLLETLEVRHESARYTVRMQVSLDVPAAVAYALFINPDNLPLINPAVKQVRVLPPPGGELRRLYTDLRLCFSLFCRHLEQVQDLRFEPRENGGALHATVIPELSDLHFGEAHWDMRDCQGRTCLAFRAELEPKFWIPPFIGPWLIQRKLRSEAQQTSAGIERLARAQQAVP